jgi:ABC-2 type transport system ATP-binding protein
MTRDTVATLEGVSRRFEETEALRGVSFSVERGSVVGLLGSNGAGKSTALRILLGLLRPDAGRSTLLGEDSLRLSRETRRRVGFLSEKAFPHEDLPLGTLLRWVAAFFDRWDDAKVKDLGTRMGVLPDRPLKSLSVGQRRKAELFLCLAPDPELLVLDDPWLGIDAIVRREVLEVVLRAAREEGRTVLFTSHVLTDVERIVDRVVLLAEGRVRADDELDALKGRTKRLLVEPAGGAVVPPLEGEVRREARGRGRGLEIVTERFEPALAEGLRASGAAVEVEDMNLEAVFVALAGGAGAAGDAAS